MRYVSVGRRFLALLIDGFLVGAAIAPLHQWFDITRSAGYFRLHIGVDGAVPGLVMIAYLIVMEAVVGASVGKLSVGVRVVNEDGSKIGWGAATVRNFVRLIDLIPYVIPYLLGATLVWTSPTRQRLGDRWGHTVVVTKDSIAAGGPGDAATAWQPGGAPPASPPPPPPVGASGSPSGSRPGSRPLPPPPISPGSPGS